jgi:hypothetical protein
VPLITLAYCALLLQCIFRVLIVIVQYNAGMDMEKMMAGMGGMGGGDDEGEDSDDDDDMPDLEPSA